MLDPDSKVYFRMRADEERAAADRAADERAAQPHRDLAERYERKAETGEAELSDETRSAHRPVRSDLTILP